MENAPVQRAPTKNAVSVRGRPESAAPSRTNAPEPELGVPFRWSQRERKDLPVRVSGTLPTWLQGQLVRTAPAEFSYAGVPIQHWFDAVNAFEDGADVVFDFLAYDDASVIDALYTSELMHGLPALAPRLVRARLAPGKKHIELEQLTDQRFEFPQIAYRAHHGKRHRFVWGTAPALPALDGAGWRSVVHKVDLDTGASQIYQDDDFIYGEPVFVERPGAQAEDDGALLVVGSHLREARARLLVLDAARLEPLASGDAELSIPLGFHGNFAFRGSS